jgi:hypothetical protein
MSSPFLYIYFKPLCFDFNMLCLIVVIANIFIDEQNVCFPTHDLIVALGIICP